jgi:hypothetical protein
MAMFPLQDASTVKGNARFSESFDDRQFLEIFYQVLRESPIL